jgi:hypothetical protein
MAQTARALLMHFGTARQSKAALEDLEKRRASARQWLVSSTIIFTHADEVETEAIVCALRTTESMGPWSGSSLRNTACSPPM